MSQPLQTIEDIYGYVVEVDNKQAVISCDFGETTYVAKVTAIGTVRKATGFRDSVQCMDEFLYVQDLVLVNIKQDHPKQKKWKVTRLYLYPRQRPDHYAAVRDYFVRRKLPARWPQPPGCHVPLGRVGEIVSLMGNVLQSWCKVHVDLFIDIVREHYDDINDAFDTYIKTERALMSFIRTVPQYFYIDSVGRVCRHAGFSDDQFRADFAFRCSQIPLRSRRHSVNDVQIIQCVRDSYAVLQPLLDRAENLQASGSNTGLVVALDCEGCSLGKTGQLTLVQIATMEGQVYIFDVLRCPHIFADGLLAEFLQSTAVLKVIHDCRQDTAALYHQFGITLNTIFDTSIAYMILQDQCQVAACRPRPRVSFQDLCEMVGEEVSHNKDTVKKKMRYIPNFWARRPLWSESIDYAAGDVYCLVPNVHEALDRLIHPNWKSLFHLTCQETIQQMIADDD